MVYYKITKFMTVPLWVFKFALHFIIYLIAVQGVIPCYINFMFKKFLFIIIFFMCFYNPGFAEKFYDNFNSNIIDNPLWSFWNSGNNPEIKAVSPMKDKKADDGLVLKLILPANHNTPGPPAGPNLGSKKLYGYGLYKARLKSPSCQLNEGIITGFFTYFNDVWNNPTNPVDENTNGIADNSEIDFEFIGAEKQCIYMSIWTDYQENPLKFRKVTRKINMVTGEIHETPEGRENVYDLKKLDIKFSPLVPDFDHSKKYYEYSFYWDSESIKYYITVNNKKIELWDFIDKKSIPTHPAYFYFNVWHNSYHWHNGLPAFPPKKNAVVRIDWAEYISLDELKD